MASVCVIFRTPALDAPYGADGTLCWVSTICQPIEGGRHTLLGLYDAIEAVKTMEPLTPSSMNAFAAALAQ